MTTPYTVLLNLAEAFAETDGFQRQLLLSRWMNKELGQNEILAHDPIIAAHVGFVLQALTGQRQANYLTVRGAVLELLSHLRGQEKLLALAAEMHAIHTQGYDTPAGSYGPGTGTLDESVKNFDGQLKRLRDTAKPLSAGMYGPDVLRNNPES